LRETSGISIRNASHLERSLVGSILHGGTQDVVHNVFKPVIGDLRLLNSNAFEANRRWLVDGQLDYMSQDDLVQLFVREERFPGHRR
jgi:hypothetical protein